MARLVTFDDGYRDNLDVAAPILVRLGVPAACFVPSATLDAPRLPWWDHVAYVVKHTRARMLRLESPFPETLELGAPKTPFLKFGDSVRIEMKDAEDRSIFGAIDQAIVQA